MYILNIYQGEYIGHASHTLKSDRFMGEYHNIGRLEYHKIKQFGKRSS